MSSEYLGVSCRHSQGRGLWSYSFSLCSCSGEGEASLTRLPPVRADGDGALGVASATFSLTIHAIDRRLVIFVITSTMLLVSRYLAFESLATRPPNSSNYTCHSISLAEMPQWTTLPFFLETPLAVISALALKPED
jgi:hypothetical protein